MKAKFSFLLICLLAINVLATAGDRTKRIDRNQRQMDAFPDVYLAPYNYNQESIVFLRTTLDPGYTTDSLSLGAEVLTQISGFYDYKTNGEANMFIQVDPSNPLNVHVVDYQADSTDATGVTTRRTLYAASTDGGATFELLSNEVPAVRSGFPVLILKDGAAIIANHSTNSGGLLDANFYYDVAPLTGVFNEASYSSHAPFGIWPQIARLGDGSFGMVSRRNVSATAPPETLYYANWNGSSSTIGSRTPIYISGMSFNGTVGSNMRFHLGASSNGSVTVIAAPVNQNDTLESSKIFARTSTNNGSTWGDVQTIFAPYTVNSGQDTVFSAAGSGFTYKPGTSNWFYMHVTSEDGLFSTAKLTLIKSNGSSVVVTDAATVGATSEYANTMSFVYSIDHPSMGWSADGSTLYCVYSVVKPDTSRTYNQRDIYAQYSLNDGTTWSNPIRITNTPTVDEIYPSVSTWNPGSGSTYEAYISYTKDPGVGPTSFGGTAPASRNNLVFRKLTGLPPIGIINNQNLTRDYHLTQNYPNPFNPVTKIEYNIIKSGFVTLKVYDVLGREVASLINQVQTAGAKEVEFNASSLPSGIYFYTLKAGDFTDTKKMMLVK